jgi:hypothetical protein
VGGLRQPDTISDLPAGMAGTWFFERDDGTPFANDIRVITLASCSLREPCGRMVVRQPGERCEYALTLREAGTESVQLEIGPAASFACGWSPLPGSIREVRPAADGTLELWLPEDHASAQRQWVPFRRVGGPAPAPDPATRVVGEVTDPRDVPRGAPDIARVTTRLDEAQQLLVLEVELVRPVPEGVYWRLAALLDPDRTGSCNAWVTAYRLEADFNGGSETKGAVLDYEPQAGFGRWFGTPGRPTPERHDLASSVAGPWVTVSIPLQQLASPEEIGYAVLASGDTAAVDDVSGPATSQGCHRVSLVGG